MNERLTKFVIVSVARSGTTFLVDLLNSHPDIYCDSEILSQRTAEASIRCFFDKQRSNNSVKACGFKIMRRQNSHLTDCVLKDHEIKKIVLLRRNHLRHFYSVTAAKQRGLFHVRPLSTTMKRRIKRIHRSFSTRNWDALIGSIKNMLLTIVCFRLYTTPYAPKRLRLNAEEFLLFVREKQAYFEAVRNVLEKHDQPYVAVYYEDFLGDDFAEACEKIQDFIGVPPARLTANTTRLHAGSLDNLIANFDEMKQQCDDQTFELD